MRPALPQEGSPEAESGVLFKSLLLVVYAALVFMRTPEIVVDGRFWAEEGSIYFTRALDSGFWKALFAPHPGYYMLFPSVATSWAAHFVSLENAPRVTVGVAFLVQMLAPALILWSPIEPLQDLRYRIGALAVLLFAVPSQEIWLTTTNSQSFMAVCAALVLISAPARGGVRVFHLIVVVLAGLSGITPTFLAPFFWLRALQERSRTRVLQASLLTLCVAIQLSLYFVAPLYGFAAVGHGGRRHLVFNPWVVSHAVFVKDLLFPFLGAQRTEAIAVPLRQAVLEQRPSMAVLVLLLAWAAANGLLAFRSRLWEARLLVAVALFVVVLGCAGSVEAVEFGWHSAHISTMGASRYYYGPNALLALALLVMSARQSFLSSQLKALLLAVVVWIIAVGHSDYMYNRVYLGGPNWQREVAAWRDGQAQDLSVWPADWKVRVTLPESSSSTPRKEQ